MQPASESELSPVKKPSSDKRNCRCLVTVQLIRQTSSFVELNLALHPHKMGDIRCVFNRPCFSTSKSWSFISLWSERASNEATQGFHLLSQRATIAATALG
jgi:hypothetical protein